MKKLFKISPFVFLLFLFPYKSQSQIIESMEGALNGISNVVGDGAIDADLVALFIDIAYYPTAGLLFGFPGEPGANDIDFARYPYDDSYSGAYRPIYESGRSVRTQFYSHFQSNEDALSGGYFQLKFSPTRFLTLDLNHLQLYEIRDDRPQNDQLGITNFSVQFNRVRNEHFHLWWGSGLMVLNGDEIYGSPTLTTGMTIYVKKPLSIYADMQAGWPNGVPAQLFQARLQVHLERFVVYSGYQGLKIGRVHEPMWAIGGGIHF